MNLKTRAASVSVPFVFSLLAMQQDTVAHPGHSVWNVRLSHTLTSPYHVSMLVLVGISFMAAGCLVRHPICRRALQTGGFCALAGAFCLWISPIY